MPTSRPDHISWLCNRVIDLKPKTILDLGFGFGSKGMLFREYTDVWNGDYFGWKTRIDGVEIYDEYITDLQRIIYDNIYTQNISLFVKTMGYYDLVYMGDVIEHFSKEEGKEVIEELKKKSRCLIIVTPVKVLAQGDVYGNKFEEHKSQWSAEDFEGFEIETFRNVMVAVYLRPGIFYCPGMEFYGVRSRVYFKFTSYQIDRPCFFMGLYFDRDYEVFKSHKGERYVFWNGSDVKRLLKNPEWQEIVTKYPAKHACHNKQLKEELKSVGVSALVRPIFFGDMDNFNVSYIPSKPTKLYINIRKGREGEYGLYKLLRVSKQVLDVEFHIYGISGESQENVFYHGLVEETYMDREIRQYQGVLRFNEHDGLSQMVIKAGLLGQYIISSNDVKGAIKAVSDDEIVLAIKEVQQKETPNLGFREYFLNRLNNFDWL